MPKKYIFQIVTVILLFVAINTSHALPEFIGYKYNSCLTCHFNGLGNGPLNDYGRALWASEIAGKLFVSNKTDEELADSSGFLGKKQLPWWIRPGIKARRLAYQINPPTKETQDILMQANLNVALFFDQDQKYAFVASTDYVPIEQREDASPGENVSEWISREHYFRWQATDDWWMYFGLTDKVYGLRIINHTAYSRVRVGLGQNDQSHGVVAHYIQPTWEWSGNIFVGDLLKKAETRHKGFSTMYEYDLKENWRIGVSALSSTSESVRHQRLGFLSKYGFGHGSAILYEMGLIEDKLTDSEAKLGYYTYGEAIQKITRGHHFFVVAQSYKDKFGSKADNIKTAIGVLLYPVARTEFRFELEKNSQYANTTEVQKDTWALLAQIHFSL